MAQYQRNFYGTSYYGNTNAFSGTYTTSEIISDEVLNGGFEVKIEALLPSAIYAAGSEEITYPASWKPNASNYLVTSTADAPLLFNAMADRMRIYYQARPDGANAKVHITTTKPGESPVTSDFTFSTNNTVVKNAYYEILLPYGNQKVEVSLDAASDPTYFLYFKHIEARVTNFTVETRVRLGEGSWSEYEKITLAITPSSNPDEYVVTGLSPNYQGKDRIQVRVWMASSDNDLSPEIYHLDTYAGDTRNRTEDALWRARIDMQNIAAALSVSFKEMISLNWISDEPNGTEMAIRTRSSSDPGKVTWKAWSVPYKLGVKRLRLKEGINTGFIVTPLMNPASISEFLRINKWMGWSDASYLPPDQSDVKIVYEFLDEQNTVIHRVDNPKTTVDKTFNTTNIGNKPFRVRISLSRRFDKATPAVDDFILYSDLIYEERKVSENVEFSAVENANTGDQMVLDMSTITFNPPPEASAPTYYLEDKTERPLDVSLYYESTKSMDTVLSRPNWTTSNQDKVWAVAKSGLVKHYQYGGGTAIFQQNDEEEMATSFTPALDNNQKYQYYLMGGWFNNETGEFVDGSVNPNVGVFWKSEQGLLPASRKQLTKKSSHNAVIDKASDLTSDIIIGEVVEESTWGEVDWVSDEKIYSGSCNVNDIKGDYIRVHQTPESGDSIDTTYIVKAGDTYASIAKDFGIDALDLQIANKARTDEIPTVGATLVIPSRIVLPAIDPRVTLGANPYQIDIVYNSVQQHGRRVDDSRINKMKLEIIQKEVLIEKEEVLRGSILNGKDFLQNPLVSDVLGIWTLPDDPVLAPNYQKNLDYTFQNGQIDWSPVNVNSREPDPGTKYYVTYKCKKPSAVKITIGTDYQEESGIDSVWRSPEVKEFSGVAQPGSPYQAALPDFSEWAGSDDPEIKDMEYIIEDNDLWVKTWIEYHDDKGEYVAVGSLQDRVPKDNWFPTIQTGFYYLGKDEYYLYSEPITYKPKDDEMPRGANIKYVEGKYENAAKFQSESKNLIRNSGFDISTLTGTVYWRGFNSQTAPDGKGVIELGK